MKYLLLILFLLAARMVGAQPELHRASHYADTSRPPQQSTYEKGDRVWLTSDDTSKVKVYKARATLPGYSLQIGIDTFLTTGTTIYSTGFTPSVKYDTIAGWHLVGDTAKGRWNPVSDMYLYEVRIYKDKYDIQFRLPEHLLWLDSNKKIFKLKVWE